MIPQKQRHPAMAEGNPAILPVPKTVDELIALFEPADQEEATKAQVVAHLTEMGRLFPEEMLAALQAYREKQTGVN